MTPLETHGQVEAVITRMVELALCDAQNFPTLIDEGNGSKIISIPGTPDLSVSMKNIEYASIYEALFRSKSFNLKLIDGALVQLLYRFSNGELVEHRLAYFPAPDLESFQNEPDVYLEDEIFAQFTKRNVVSTPIRFDFNSSNARHHELLHSKSHLTLGQFQNCRIPVSAPLSPVVFMTFIVRHFYNTGAIDYSDRIGISNTFFPNCVTELESGRVHLNLGNIR